MYDMHLLFESQVSSRCSLCMLMPARFKVGNAV